jgi:hypothetical protein
MVPSVLAVSTSLRTACRAQWPQGLRVGLGRLVTGIVGSNLVRGMGRPLRRADNTSKGVLPSVLIGLRNLRCEATKVLTRTVEPLMMTTTSTTNMTMELSELLNYKGKKMHVIEGVKISVPIKCLMYDTNIKKNYQSTLINRYIGKRFRY